MAIVYESLLQKEERDRAELQIKYDEQAKARDEKLFKLKFDNLILASLKKKTAQTMIYEPSKDSAASGKGGKAGSPLDFTKILNTLRQKIKTIHTANKVGSGEVESKPTLQLLHEIESLVIKYIRNVARRRRKDDQQVQAIEKQQALGWKQKNTDDKKELKIKEQEEKNRRMIQQRERPRHR